MKEKKVEYIEKKTVAVLLIYNAIFILISIFSFFVPAFKNYFPFKIIFGISVVISFIILFIFGSLYKNKTAIKLNKKIDLINKILTYFYILNLIIFLFIYYFSFPGEDNKILISNILSSILVYITSSLMFLSGLSIIIINSISLKNNNLNINLDELLKIKELEEKQNKEANN